MYVYIYQRSGSHQSAVKNGVNIPRVLMARDNNTTRDLAHVFRHLNKTLHISNFNSWGGGLVRKLGLFESEGNRATYLKTDLQSKDQSNVVLKSIFCTALSQSGRMVHVDLYNTLMVW